MNIVRKNNDNDTVSLWKKECKRLEKERNNLLAELNAVKEYKKRYEDLINEVSKLKDRYLKLMKQTESLSDEYKKKLEKIIKTAK